MEPEKSAFLLPVPPVIIRTGTRGQGLNLHVCSIQMAVHLERQWVLHPKRVSYISFQASLFYKEGRGVGKEFGTQEKG